MKILAFAPHPDDIELGCGASISKWLKEGHEVYAVSLSTRNESKNEFDESCRIMGIINYERYEFPVRRFNQCRQQILDRLLEIRKRISPDLVIIPSTNDTHQDHQVVRDEGFRAFKRVSLIGYEMPQNNLTFNTTMFVRVSKEDVENKFNCLSCYKSQDGRPYLTKEFIESLARVRGMQAGSEFSEAFEVIRWVL